ncbi:hypothetical protein ABZ128_20765 [Streptomyces sp. NPDC006326]|uniref:hypothetical protein n=1 Tax=Streptomyces sp. NPDC006326 TaxID=3156752 RepID=UPI0033A62DE7
MPPVALSPETVTNLVQLRALADSADRASISGSFITRSMAVVLLDAVNERVTHFAATYLTLSVPSKAGFEQLMDIVKASLGSRWKTATWPDVRRLHRTRNLVQHEGLEVDQQNITVWAAATSSYVRSLVDAVWDVDIQEVTLSRAVKDPAVRELLERAEREISEESPSQSLRSSFKAFELAYNHWADQYRGRDSFHRKPMGHEISDPKSFDFLYREITEISEASVATAFSGDPGEYVWFRDIVSYHGAIEIATLDEAQRALGFVFGWIIRWEAFREAFIPNRMAVREAQKRRVRSANGPARVDAVRALVGSRQVRLEIDLTDVPPTDDFSLWQRALWKVLGDLADSPQGVRVKESGCLTFTFPRGVEIPEDLAGRVLAALIEADREVQLVRAKEQRERLDGQSEVEAYSYAYGEIRDRFPEWVNEVEFSGPAKINGRLRSRLTFSVIPEAFNFSSNVTSGVMGHPLVRSCTQRRIGTYVVTPELSPSELCEVLQSISEDIGGLIKQRKMRTEEDKEFRRSIEHQLRNAFRL